MAMENGQSLTVALIAEIEAWIEEHNINVGNKERVKRILGSPLTHEDVPILYGEIGSDLAKRIKSILHTK
mgnify:CR=1 FL=1